MPPIDPLVNAISDYIVSNWDESNWRAFGRQTGTSDILSDHGRLYRSLTFGDPDYADAVLQVLPLVLKAAVDVWDDGTERLRLLGESFPSLVDWTVENAPYRTKKLLMSHLSDLPAEMIPSEWIEAVVRFGPDSRKGTDKPTLDISPAPVPLSEAPFFLPPQGVIAAVAVRLAEEREGRQQSMQETQQFEEQQPEEPAPAPAAPVAKQIFIVHGDDSGPVREVQFFVYKITGIMPTTLVDAPGGGSTAIEKFERETSGTDFAIVLLTSDDSGHARASSDSKPRARQDVVFELGYFFGKLGRSKVVVLDTGVERPSDVQGLSYIAFPDGNWKHDLSEELKFAGIERQP